MKANGSSNGKGVRAGGAFAAYRIDPRKADLLISWASLTVFCLYLVRMLFDRTMYRSTCSDWYSAETLRAFSFSLLILRFAVADLWKKLTLKQWMFAGAAEFILFMSYASTGYTFLMDLGIYLILLAGIEMRLILGIYCGTASVVYLTAMFGALSGSIEDLIYYATWGDTFTIRRSLGVVYPTDCAAAWFYLAITFWLLARKLPGIVSVFLMLGTAGLSWRLCRARNSLLCLIAAAVGVSYYYFSEFFIRRKGRRGLLIRIFDEAMVVAFPVFAVVTVLLSWFYPALSNFFKNVMNISGMESFVARFELAYEAFLEYGLTFFGTPFRMVSIGSSALNNGVSEGYNFVDCAYSMIFVRYGLLLLILFGVMYVMQCNRAIRENQRKLLVVMALIALHNVTEHHYPEVCYNITLVLFFASFDEKAIYSPAQSSRRLGRNSRTRAGEKKATGRNGSDPSFREGLKSWLTILYAAAITAGFVFFLPRLLSYGRTLVTLGTFDVKSQRIFLILFLLVMLISAGLFFACLWFLVCRLIAKKAGAGMRWIIGVFTVSVLAGLSGMLWAQNIIEEHIPEYLEQIEGSEPVVEALREGESDGAFAIYVDDIPELYKNHYGEEMITDHLFTGNGLCMEEDCVLITEKKYDLNLLILQGFEYGELPGGQGVYSNSGEATALLEKAGVKMSGTFTSRKKVDLEKQAEEHEMTLSEDGGLVIDGNLESSRDALSGSGIKVYSGTLKVKYRLRLISTTAVSGRIGKLLIRSEGMEPYASRDIMLEDFENDEINNLSLTVELPADLNDLEFPVIADEGTVLEVLKISYGKIDTE